jgi:hypothetical protein
MSTIFEGPLFGSAFTINIPSGGFSAPRTTGTQSIQAGFASLTCDEYVYATLIYTSYSPTGIKLAEATVFSADEIFWYTNFIADYRDGQRLGIAVANDTDISHTYRVTAVVDGSTRTGTFVVPPRANLARFVDDLVSIPNGFLGLVRIESLDYSDFYAVGLKYTGASVFTAVPIDD